jgi:hypothetical protein
MPLNPSAGCFSNVEKICFVCYVGVRRRMYVRVAGGNSVLSIYLKEAPLYSYA